MLHAILEHGLMALGEIVAFAALGLSLVLLLLLWFQARRLGRLEARLKALTVGTGSGVERMSLFDLVSWQANRLDGVRSEVVDLKTTVEALEAITRRSVQRVGFVRYNPFEDTGGDQSFALALLDGQGNGVIFSSLHMRTATRFYAKPVKGGTSLLSLSDEEVTALKQAMESTTEPGEQIVSH